MSKPIVITIHGVRTAYGKNWQAKLENYAKAKVAGHFDFKHYQYGFLPAITSWYIAATKKFKMISLFRGFYINGFVKYIKKIHEKYPSSPINVIAHSFGGWILEQAIYKLQSEENIKFNNIIFMHCPISEYLYETGFRENLRIRKINAIFSHSSHADKVIGMVAIPPFGKNGYYGFVRSYNKMDLIEPPLKPYEDYALYNITYPKMDVDHDDEFENLWKYGPQIVHEFLFNIGDDPIYKA